MPLTRTFRSGMSMGRDGRQQPIRSNFQSGPGANGSYEPGAGGGYGTGQGYGTGASGDEAPITPLARTSSGPSAPAMAPRRGITPLSRSGPNRGGTITRGGAKASYAPSAYGGAGPRPNAGGTMTRAGMTASVPPSPAAIRSSLTNPLQPATPAATGPALDTPGDTVASPTTTAEPQTESANPLTGDGNAQAGGTTDAIDPGAALGLSQRGGSVPPGADAQPANANVGGSGLYARKFAHPKSASIYSDYVKKLFGDSGA